MQIRSLMRTTECPQTLRHALPIWDWQKSRWSNWGFVQIASLADDDETDQKRPGSCDSASLRRSYTNWMRGKHLSKTCFSSALKAMEFDIALLEILSLNCRDFSTLPDKAYWPMRSLIHISNDIALIFMYRCCGDLDFLDNLPSTSVRIDEAIRSTQDGSNGVQTMVTKWRPTMDANVPNKGKTKALSASYRNGVLWFAGIYEIPRSCEVGKHRDEIEAKPRLDARL